MATCGSATLTGIEVGCKDNMGGIKAVWISPFDGTITIDTTSDKVSDITGGDFKKYTFRKQTGGMNSTLTVDDTVGTQYWTTELTLQFSKMETSKAVEINALTWTDTIVIVKDSNNKYWLLGYDNPVSTTASTAQTGTNYGDLNGYTLTLNDMSKNLPYELTDEAVTALGLD